MTDLPTEGISFGTIPGGNNYIVDQQIICSAGGNPGPDSYKWTDLEDTSNQIDGQTLNLTKA